MNGDDNYPYAIPVNYLYDEENQKIYFHGSRVGHKADAIKNCLVTDIIQEMTPIRFDGHLSIDRNSAFLGVGTRISEKRWNLDIWWKEKSEIEEALARARNMAACMEERPEIKRAVMEIKRDLIARKLYGFDKGKKHYHSQEIYEAVFDDGILTAEQFLLKHPK